MTEVLIVLILCVSTLMIVAMGIAAAQKKRQQLATAEFEKQQFELERARLHVEESKERTKQVETLGIRPDALALIWDQIDKGAKG